jgi:hypothetical protein
VVNFDIDFSVAIALVCLVTKMKEGQEVCSHRLDSVMSVQL